MDVKSALIPTRFITILGHFVMLIMALDARDSNIKACLAYEFELEEYAVIDKQLVIGISLAFTLLGIELLGFLCGLSMFMPLVCSISIATHAIACMTLSYWLTDNWDCAFFWWNFCFCSLLPGFIEIGVLLNILTVKRFMF